MDDDVSNKYLEAWNRRYKIQNHVDNTQKLDIKQRETFQKPKRSNPYQSAE